MNYTDEQRKYMVSKYKSNPSKETVLELAEEFKKTPKSIIGKLSKEGVYKREVYKTKRGETPRTKLEIVQVISTCLGVDELPGLEKTPKLTLQKIEQLITEPE